MGQRERSVENLGRHINRGGIFKVVEKAILDRIERIVGQIRDTGDWVCFGAGRFFYDFVNQFCVKQKILPYPKYVCDNNAALWGKQIYGVQVVSPQRLLEEEADKTIIAMSAITPFGIESDLFSCSLQRHYFLIIPLTQIESYFYFSENNEKVNQVLYMLADDNSKEYYQNYWRLTLSGIMNYAGIYTPNAYWNNDIVPKLMNGWDILYAGAFDGKHIDRALKNNADITFHGFEPNQRMYVELCKKYGKANNIKLYPYALNNKKGALSFDPNVLLGAMVVRSAEFGGVRISSQLEEVYSSRIDDEITGKLDLLALDIEGSEMEALEGAKSAIQAFKPILGICTYHRINHYVDIPLYIKELSPDYRLLFRHHSVSSCESVIYALNESN